MSYEWIRRRKRYLSFRYLFPELVAPWIQLKRALLRVLWFFTHPVDEFFEDLGELIAWPFVAAATFSAWTLAGVREFFKDLFEGIEACFVYLGRLPVWTGSAIAGALGIIMTILLFFLQVASFEPVPLSTGPATPATVMSTPAADTLWRPEPQPPETFDAFAGSPSPQPEPWRPSPTSTSVPSSAIAVELSRLALPFDARQRIDVVSTSAMPNSQAAWTQFERMNASTGWSLTRIDGVRPSLQVTPYVVRQPIRNLPIAPGWVNASDQVSPFEQVQNSRQPAVSIARTAPASASVGGSMTYELLISNQGLEPLDRVTVHETVSAIDRVMDVQPPAHVVDNALVWTVADLQPREQRRLMIEVRPDRLVPVSGGSTLRVKTSVAAVSRVAPPTEPAPPITPSPEEELNVFLPEPKQEPAPLPEPAPDQQIGMILPTFHDEPQPEPEPPPQQAEPSFTFEPLPDKTPQPEPAILPLAPLPRRAEPTLAQHPPREQVETIRESNGVPIFFEMRTPTIVKVDGAVATVFEIRNPGTAPLTDLVILVEVTDELNHKRGRILEHRIERLAPGGVYFTRLTTTAVRNGTARVRSTLTSAEQLESTLEAEIEVSHPDKPPAQLSAIDLPVHGPPTSTQ